MIEYANELVKEIQDNHPTNATTIKVMGVPINRVSYTGVGLEIECEDLDFVEKWKFDGLQQDYDMLNDDHETLQDDYDALEDEAKNMRTCLEKIRDKIEKRGQWDTFTDEIVEMIEEVLE